MATIVAGQRLTADVVNRHRTLSDTTTRTITAASLTQISGSFSIGANDLKAGDMYELVCWGGGTQGSTQQNLSYKLSAFGSDFAAGTMLGTVIAASQTFRWMYKGFLMVLTTGVTGTTQAQSDFRWAQNTTHSATNAALGVDAGNPTIDTTSATTMLLKVQWASTTGAPTISCTGSFLRRIDG